MRRSFVVDQVAHPKGEFVNLTRKLVAALKQVPTRPLYRRRKSS